MATPRRFLVLAGLGTALCASVALAEQAPSLGSAASFAVLGATSVTNSGPTVISGNAGVAPGTTITGLPDSTIRLGEKIANDDRARQAQRDAAAAYDSLTATCSHLPVLTDVPIPPGVYCVTTPFAGVTTLDPGPGAGGPWIFQVTGNLTLMPNAAVSVINGGENGNVYWQVPGSVLLGAGSTMAGNILARGDITLGHGASLLGRALSLTGKVTLDSNTVSLCCEPIALSSLPPDGVAGTPYSSTITASGGVGPYTLQLIEGSIPTGQKCGHFDFTVMATDILGCHGLRKYSVDIKSAIDIVPHVLPPATACIDYEQALTTTGAVGTVTFCGTPPAPLTLSKAGLLSGPPPAPGTYSFPVCATDSAGCATTRTFTLFVNPGALTIAPPSLPPGTVGVPYQQTFTPSGCPGPFTCVIAGAPPGLVPTNCALSGIPTATGIYPVTVTAHSAGGSTGSRSYQLPINCAPITVTTDTLPDGVVGVAYNAQLQAATIIAPPYTFALAPGSSLPPGFDPLPASGALSGPPTIPGLYKFLVIAKDQYSCASVPHEITLRILPAPVPNCQPLTLSPATVPNGIAGVSYPPTQITATGGTGSETFLVSSGTLPPGLALSATGLLSGIPATTGAYCVTILGTDPQGCTGTITYSIIINPAPCPVISLSPTFLPPAIVNDPYNVMLTAAGGTAPYTFTVFSGALPPGLTLNSATGVISGIPTTAGVSNITFIATDANGCIGTLGCSIVLVTYVPAMSPARLMFLALSLALVGLILIGRNG